MNETSHSLDATWAELTRRWDEPEAHRALLSTCGDLEALADAGRRYRAVLEAHPTDARALEMKAEILKRATIIGLSQLPRNRPPTYQVDVWPRRLLLAGVLAMAAALAWMLGRLTFGTAP